MSLMQDLGLLEVGSFLWDLMLAFSFFVGIFLIVSREAVECLSRDFQREMGWRRYILSQLEEKQFTFIDAFIFKYPIWIGLMISTISFLLLLVRRM